MRDRNTERVSTLPPCRLNNTQNSLYEKMEDTLW